MNRGLGLASVLAAALIAGSFSLSACARAPESAGNLSRWQAGTNYNLLAKPQPASATKGKVEVVEVFWYGCGHCYALDPLLEGWKTTKPEFIEFVRIPVVWGPVQRQHAKLFYVLQALGRSDLHSKVFDTIHRDGVQLVSQEETKARALQYAFVSQNGVSEKDFDNAYDSMTVSVNLQRAQDYTARNSIGSVPLMIVNGKYSTDVTQAGSPTALLSLITDLASSEQTR